jgi:hypothetical protein
MALARIITRSHQCARELALDLLARGYAVEIVSPDKIPDNIADLELRVDAGPGDQLIASVEVHNGERSASLEFLHHLKSPMGDFVRRIPEDIETPQLSEETIGVNAGSSREDVELAAQALMPTEKIDSPSVKLIDSGVKHPESTHHEFGREEFSPEEFNPKLDFEEGARLISPDLLPLARTELQIQYAEEISDVAEPIVTAHIAEEVAGVQLGQVQSGEVEAGDVHQEEVHQEKVQPAIFRPIPTTKWRLPNEGQRDRRSGLPARPILAFAALFLLILAVGYGLRRSGKTFPRISGTIPVERVAAASSAPSPATAVPGESSGNKNKEEGKITPVVPLPPPTKSSGSSDGMAKHVQPAKVEAARSATTATAGAPTTSSRHGDGLVARDTVTYLDKSFAANAAKTKTAKKSARGHASSNKHAKSGVAPNTVIYLNNNSTPVPDPKIAK